MRDNGSASPRLELSRHLESVVIDVSWVLPDGGASLYVLCADVEGNVSALSQVVFPMAPKLPGDGVVHRREDTKSPHAFKEQVQVVFELLPADVAKLELVLAASRPGVVLTQLSAVKIECWTPRSGETLGTWTVANQGLSKRVELGIVGRADPRWYVHIQPEASDYEFDELFASRLSQDG